MSAMATLCIIDPISFYLEDEAVMSDMQHTDYVDPVDDYKKRIEDALGLEVDPREHHTAYFERGEERVVFVTFCLDGVRQEGEAGRLFATTKERAFEVMLQSIVAYKDALSEQPINLHWRMTPYIESLAANINHKALGGVRLHTAYCRLAITCRPEPTKFAKREHYVPGSEEAFDVALLRMKEKGILVHNQRSAEEEARGVEIGNAISVTERRDR